MLTSDLLKAEVIKVKIQELEKAKDYLIFAATGQIEENDSLALEHLKKLAYLTGDLESLLENLPFITIDLESICKA